MQHVFDRQVFLQGCASSERQSVSSSELGDLTACHNLLTEVVTRWN